MLTRFAAPAAPRTVEVLDPPRKGDAVHHDERFVARHHRTDAADPDIHRDAGAVGPAAHDVHARDPGLDGLDDVGRRRLSDLRRVHRRDRAGEVAPLLGAVADDHEPLEGERRGDELKVHGGRLRRLDHHRACDRRVADEPGPDLMRPGRHRGEEERTGRVGGGYLVRADDGDRRAGDRAAVGRVGDPAADLTLGLHLAADPQAQGNENQERTSHEYLPGRERWGGVSAKSQGDKITIAARPDSTPARRAVKQGRQRQRYR